MNGEGQCCCVSVFEYLVFRSPLNLFSQQNSIFSDLVRAKTDPRARLKHVNVETKEALAELDRTYVVPELSKLGDQSTAKADKFNAAPFSTGKVAASFTSTASTRETVHEAAILEDDIVR